MTNSQNVGIATLIETTSRQSDDINVPRRGQAAQWKQSANLVAGQAAMHERLNGF